MHMCKLAVPGVNPFSFASYTPAILPMNSDIVFLWNQGGLKVFSIASHLGGKTTKSHTAWPGSSLAQVNTVKIDGSGWSLVIDPQAINFLRSYL